MSGSISSLTVGFGAPVDLGIGGFPSFPRLSFAFLSLVVDFAFSRAFIGLLSSLCPFLFVFRPFIVVLGEPDFFSANRNWSRSGRARIRHPFISFWISTGGWTVGRTDSADSDRRISADCFPIYVLRQQTKRTFSKSAGLQPFRNSGFTFGYLIWHGRLLSFSIPDLVLCYLSVLSASE